MKSKHLMTGFAIVLLIYAAYRSWDYMSGSLQGVDRTTAYLVAAVFLFASEIGLLLWLHFAQPNATTDIQETTANVMIGVNFIGSMILGLADLLKHNTLYVVNLSWLDPLLLLAPWVLIAANVLGHIVYHLADSEESLKREERRLVHEEARLEIAARSKAVEELNRNRAAIAEKLAPGYYADLVSRVEGRTLARFERQAKNAAKRLVEQVPIYGRNGHQVYNAEAEEGTENLPNPRGDGRR